MSKTKAVLLTIFSVILANIIAFRFIDMSTKSQIDISNKMILNEARAQFKDTIYTREWNAQFNGVYVDSDTLKPNKYLVNNHIFTKDNKKLIKINHAWMTKQISEISNNYGDYYYKLTSLKPINPENSPDKFEKNALKKLEKEHSKEYFEFSENLKRFNYVGALKVKPSCMECHYVQNYKIGDYIGGIRITVPTKDYKIFYESIKEKTYITKLILVIISIFFLLILIWFINSIYSRQELINQMAEKQKELSQRYKLAIEGSNDGLWDWDLVTNEVYFSKRWKAMLGYEVDELENALETWEKLVNPEDLEKAQLDITNNHKGITNRYENIHRLKHKDGHWVWILDRGKTFYDKNGNPKRMLGFHSDITEQKELEISLNNSQESLMNAEKMAHLAHWSLDIKSMELTVSDNIRRIFGLEKDAPFGMKELFKTFVYEDDRELVSNKLTQNVNTKTPYNIEYRFKKSNDDEIRYINCNIEHEVIDEKVVKTIGTIQDVTNINLIQEELKILRVAIEHAPISFILTDKNGVIEYVNPCFTKTTGYTYEEALKQKSRIFKSDFIKIEEYEKLWETISSGKTWSGTLKDINKDGEEFWELAFISPIFSNKEGEIIKYLAIKQEITKEVFLKQELQDKEELMIAQSRHAAMGEMISMIAHQWRQPIAVVAMGANNIMADIELDILNSDSLKENLDEIISQTEYLSQTIDDFKNFFKPNKQKDLVTVESIFAETFKVMGKMLENSDIEVIQNYKSETQVYTYTQELLQVFINIIKNAKEVLVEKREDNRVIKINEFIKDDHIIIQVSDNAGGIDIKNIDNIFDPYFTTKEQVGTGLGLYMSKTIIEKHLNGKLLVSNTEDGACFEIRFSIKDM
ncbi:MAG: PAS domain-containing protein [Arcobacter sp.]|uniref:PAS domain-containing protein n=1 Tax=Arcobacter sp. TaxID=1872629 RepID=UPI003B00A145